jgi:anti-sigma factor RsiW
VARIIPFRRDVHHEAQLLLPWYAKGRLDAEDRELVEAHLAVCSECAAELDLERQFAVELAELPLDADRGWERLRGRLDERTPRGERPTARRRRRFAEFGAIAAAICLAAVLSVATFRSLETSRYRTLGAPQSGVMAPAMIVLFRPETSEADLRRILVEADARLVDGPTAAGAYVVRAPTGRQGASLAVLRRQPQVVMAQPIDAATRP